MSFQIQSSVANKFIKDGEYEVSLYENCSYEWKFDEDYVESEPLLIRGNTRSTDRMKYSKVFSTSDPVCRWCLVLQSSSENCSYVSLVLRSVQNQLDVEANFKLELVKDSTIHDTIVTHYRFSAGKASPSIKLCLDLWGRKATAIRVTVRARIETVSVKQSDVLHTNSRNKLVGDIGALMNKDSIHDMIIKVTSGKTPQEIPVHRAILAARSSVFAAMVEHDMLERNDGCVEVVDFQAPAVEEMISFMYTGAVRTLTLELACELLKLSDKYDMPDLKDFCETHLVSEINVGNATDILYLADFCNSKRLKEEAISFISEYFHAFDEDGPFKELSCSRNRVVNELIARMSRDMKKIQSQRNEVNVFLQTRM